VETESKIQDELAKMMLKSIHHKKTPSTNIVIAQRISTVLNADKILVLDDGKIAAQGTHQELLNTSSIYREIFDSQLGNGVLEHE
jgi:ATP-binding cassette subfamily B protein